MTKTKKYFFFLGLLVALLLPALGANAETTLTGKLTGITCLVKGYICPIDKADPMINLETDFVLVTASGDYYLLSNIGLGLKAKYALEVVDVTGDVNSKYKSIKVSKFSKGGNVVWSQAMENEMIRALMDRP
jgi:hypothetical protein